MDPMPMLEDLVWLFESEPVYPFGIDDAPWPYVCVRFALTRGSLRVEVEVEPASELVKLSLSSGGDELSSPGFRGGCEAALSCTSGRGRH